MVFRVLEGKLIVSSRLTIPWLPLDLPVAALRILTPHSYTDNVTISGQCAPRDGGCAIQSPSYLWSRAGLWHFTCIGSSRNFKGLLSHVRVYLKTRIAKENTRKPLGAINISTYLNPR